jgi:hypothetical protein
LYKDIPNPGDLFVSTVVKLPATKDLDGPIQSVHGNITTVTYTIKHTLSLPAGIRTPADEQIAWDGRERIVRVVVDDGGNNEITTMNTEDLD